MVSGRTLSEMATDAVGMHPTGMYSCLQSSRSAIVDWIYALVTGYTGLLGPQTNQSIKQDKY